LIRALLAGLALGLTLARPAHAQPTKAEARAVYAKGKAAYERGEYDVALSYFEQAYRLSPLPALLFNMAQAHRLSGPEHCQQALDLYRKYVVADPEAKNRAEAIERIDEMQKCAARAESEKKSLPSPSRAEPMAASDAERNSVPPVRPAPSTPAVKPSRTAIDSRSRRARSPAPIIVTGASAAIGVAGVILYARARAKYDEVEKSCPCPPGAFSDWETLTSVSYALMAVGAVGTVSGVSWYLLGGENGSGVPRGFLVGATGRF